jgi:hypothetical protein
MHPTDGMWQEYLDRQCEVPVQQELALHSAMCTSCQQTIAALDHRRSHAANLLDLIDATVPARSLAGVLSRRRRRSSSPQTLLVAAIVALCVVTAAGASVRAGLFHRALDWLLGPRPPIEAPAPVPAIGGGQQPSSTGVAFESSGPVEIAFEEWPAAGEILILLREGPRVSVAATAPSAYSVRKGKVVVGNRGVSASYRVTLPKDAASAAIRVGNRVIFSKQGDIIRTRAKQTGSGAYALEFESGRR